MGSNIKTMGPGLTLVLGVLLMSGLCAGFKTKICDHEETVNTIKKTYDCALEFAKEFLKKDMDLANAGLVMMSALGDATQKCMSVVLGCVPMDQFEKLMSNPSEVVATDNSCKVEQIMGVAEKVQKCAKDYGYQDSGKEPEVTEELCDKIGSGDGAEMCQGLWISRLRQGTRSH